MNRNIFARKLWNKSNSRIKAHQESRKPTHAHKGVWTVCVCAHVFWICLTRLSLHLGQYTTIYTYFCQLGRIKMSASKTSTCIHLLLWPTVTSAPKKAREGGSLLPQGARSVSFEIKHEFFKWSAINKSTQNIYAYICSSIWMYIHESVEQYAAKVSAGSGECGRQEKILNYNVGKKCAEFSWAKHRWHSMSRFIDICMHFIMVLYVRWVCVSLYTIY